MNVITDDEDEVNNVGLLTIATERMAHFNRASTVSQDEMNRKKNDEYECSEWSEIEKYYTVSGKEKINCSFAEFANAFLSNQRSISELWRIVDEDKRRITERMSPKEQALIIQMAENLLYERLCAMALGEENDLWSILGELRGYSFLSLVGFYESCLYRRKCT